MRRNTQGDSNVNMPMAVLSQKPAARAQDPGIACVAVCCTATHCNTLQHTATHWYTHIQHANGRAVSATYRARENVCRRRLVCCSVVQCVAMCCSVLQCVAVCGSVLQCVALCCSVLQCVVVCCSVLQCAAVPCSVMQRVVVRYSVMQCVAAFCSVLQCITHKNVPPFCACACQHDESIVCALYSI